MTKIMCSVFSAASLLVALGGCSVPGSNANQTAQNANTAGWTGHTFVVGSHSTVAGDAAATELQQRGGRGGGGRVVHSWRRLRANLAGSSTHTSLQIVMVGRASLRVATPIWSRPE